jgi:hypothetical protein
VEDRDLVELGVGEGRDRCRVDRVGEVDGVDVVE